MGGTAKRMSGAPQAVQPLQQSIIDALMSGNVGPNMGNNSYNQAYMNSTRAAAGNKPVLGNYLKSGVTGFGDANWHSMDLDAINRYKADLADWRFANRDTAGGNTAFLDMLNKGLFASGPTLGSFMDPANPIMSGIRGGYEDLFSQRRSDALAQAKEMSGNLTGTGYAENLGRTVQRSLADENALLTQLMSQLGLAQYGQEQQNAQNNAQRFLQFLMGQSLAGIAPDTIVQSGGAGQILSPLLTGLGYWAGGPLGGFLGGAAGQGANTGG